MASEIGNDETSSLEKWIRRSPAFALQGLIVGASSFEIAEGALVIIEPDLELTPPLGNTVFGLVDFDGNGPAEVGVTVGTASVLDGAGHNGIVNVGGLGGAQLAFSAGGYPQAFQASDVIGSSLNFRTAIGSLAFSSGGRLGCKGNWFGGADAYFGVHFLLGGTPRYGWIHAVWEPDVNTLTIDRAGYEDTGAAAEIPSVPAYPPDFQHRFGENSDPGNGRMEIIWPVLGGKTYEVQRSLDLDGWTTIHTVTPVADGESSYLDDEFEGAPKERCFYRVAQQLPSPPEMPPDFQHHFGENSDPENGLMEIIWPVLAGKTYEVQRSLDLDGWTTIHTVTPVADGESSYLDDEFEGAPKERCFYRVAQQLGSPLLLLALGLRRRQEP